MTLNKNIGLVILLPCNFGDDMRYMAQCIVTKIAI